MATGQLAGSLRVAGAPCLGSSLLLRGSKPVMAVVSANVRFILPAFCCLVLRSCPRQLLGHRHTQHRDSALGAWDIC